MIDAEIKKLEAENLNLRFKEVHDKLEEVCTTLDKILEQTERINDTISEVESRTTKLEETNRHCPVLKVKDDFEDFKKKASVFMYFIDHPKMFWMVIISASFIFGFDNLKEVFELFKNLF